MADRWQYQIRLYLSEANARLARQRPNDPALAPVADVLAQHDATLKCQYDAFAGYVAEAEARGIDGYPLYAWTKATIEDPAKEAKYIRAFTVHVDGDEVYGGDKADALEADLMPLVGGDIVTKLSKHDTNPANNPQPPKRYRR